MIYSLQQRKQPGLLLLAVLSAMVAAWQLIGVAEIQATTLAGKFAFDTAELMLMMVIPPLLFAFALHFTNRHRVIPGPILIVLYLIPLTGIGILLNSQPTSDLFRSQIRVVSNSWITGLDYRFGPAYYLYGAYSLCLVLIAVGIMVHRVTELPPYRRANVKAIAVAIALPWLLSLAIYIGVPHSVPRGVNVIPVALMLTSLVIIAEFVRQRSREIIPAVREAVMDSMRDGVLVVDMDGRIIDHNTAGRRILPVSLIGTPLGEVLPELLPLRDQSGHLPTDSRFTLDRSLNQSQRHFAGQISPLNAKGGNRLGSLITLQDITEEWKAQQTIEQARHTAEKRARELEAIQRTMRAVSSDMPIDNLLETILECAISLVEAKDGEIALYDPERNEVEIVISLGLEQDFRGVRLGLGEGVMGRVAKSRDALVIKDYHSWSGRSPTYNCRDEARTVVAVPLLSGDGIVGVIGVGFYDAVQEIEREELDILTLFAQQAAVALRNAQLYEEISRRAEEAETLRRAGAAVAATLEQQETINRLLEQMDEIVDFDRATVQIRVNHSTQVVGQRGFRIPAEILNQSFPLHQDSPFRIIYTSQQPQIIGDLVKDYPLFLNPPFRGVRGWLGVPLNVEGEIFGLVSLYSHAANHFSDEDARHAKAFADQVAGALYNARQFSEVQLLAITDPLTGVYNRRRFFDLAHNLSEQAQRERIPLAVIMVDVDHFKLVNDRFGHATGDEVLRVLAQRCNSILREGDIFARYGGEEFAILLPHTSANDAIAVSERLRAAIQTDPIVTDDGPISITASLGVAALNLDTGERVEATILRADNALYSAKDSGRNRVVYFP